MSGGVDSSVAAALLKQAGHEVSGATMQLYTSHDTKNKPDAVTDARKVAEKLGIQHHIIDLRDVFAREIIAYFCDVYRAGRTPNPCVRCNRLIKFGVMMEKARELGAEFLATGHYARLEKDKASGKYLLKKGKDPLKDQSYFLCRLMQEQLAHTLFPLGDMSKTEVRKMAREMGLPTAEKPESQEICFVPGDDHASFLASHAPAAPQTGPIYDSGGKRLGQHQGIMYYTIGQRKGLGIAASAPLYVTAIEAENNVVIVGSKAQTYSDALVAGDINWVSGTAPEFPLKVKAKVRYRHPEAEATITAIDKDNVYVKFAAPQMAIAPGQSVVFYDGDNVIGGGTIFKQGR
ncbi:MAG: tRNA 2-thiouridine(34) synthase MnmA [Dehalococcoidales bacterium]